MRPLWVGIVFGMALSGSVLANPCRGVNRHLSAHRALILNPIVAKQLGIPKAAVLQSFRLNAWNILYVETYQSDEAYLFFPSSPLSTRYVTVWGGDAMSSEEDDIRSWTIKNAPGIPDRLARCFAWHVTKDR
jgi:hypothetical protein